MRRRCLLCDEAMLLKAAGQAVERGSTVRELEAMAKKAERTERGKPALSPGHIL